MATKLDPRPAVQSAIHSAGSDARDALERLDPRAALEHLDPKSALGHLDPRGALEHFDARGALARVDPRAAARRIARARRRRRLTVLALLLGGAVAAFLIMRARQSDARSEDAASGAGPNPQYDRPGHEGETFSRAFGGD
jgi:ferric-dicitrate binding protein FerR (iron transport regulator)